MISLIHLKLPVIYEDWLHSCSNLETEVELDKPTRIAQYGFSMYAKYFGLSEMPFKIIPDPRFLWYSDQHKEAKAKIEFHIKQKDGPVYLSAEVGLGKTSIAQRLRNEFATDKLKKVVLAFAPNLKTANQFMRFIADKCWQYK